MSNINIEVAADSSARLMTAGKYCDKNIVVTALQATPVISVSSSGLITATAGSKSATQQLDTQEAKTVIPGTSDQTAVSSGRYTTGAIIVKGDANFKEENIAEGVSMFGKVGTHASGKQVASGQFIPATYTGNTIREHPITISGLAFKPTRVIVYLIGKYTANGVTYSGQSTVHGLVMLDSSGYYLASYSEYDEDADYDYWYLADPTTDPYIPDDYKPKITFTSDGFTVSSDYDGEYDEVTWYPHAYRYIAYG